MKIQFVLQLIIFLSISLSNNILKAQDNSITQDSNLLQISDNYENQFWSNLEKFRDHILQQIGNNGYNDYTDARARELGYSSAMGLAVYHILDEMYSLSWVLDATRDDTHREKYAALAKEFLDIIVNAIVSGQGTASGQFRYLDEAHGTGAAGMVMNAIYENQHLRNIYFTDLKKWATQLKPVLDGNFDRSTSLNCNHPHMSCKIAPGFIAVGKILEIQEYIDAFERIAEMTIECADNRTTAWVGSDLSHARISIVVLHMAYREYLRDTFQQTVTTFQMQRVTQAYLNQISNNSFSAYGCLVRFSDDMESNVQNNFTFSGNVGSHALAKIYENVAGLTIGFVTRLHQEKNQHGILENPKNLRIEN
jgi:hypothetical protein